MQRKSVVIFDKKTGKYFRDWDYRFGSSSLIGAKFYRSLAAANTKRRALSRYRGLAYEEWSEIQEVMVNVERIGQDTGVLEEEHEVPQPEGIA